MANRSTTEPVPDGHTVPVRPPGAAAPELVPVKLTDVGRSRPHNEDYVDMFVPDDPQQLAARGSLFLVADGMGGHQAGEVASQRAVEMVLAEYYGDTTHDVPTTLVRAFRRANETLFAQAQADPAKGGMGTTLVAAAILGTHVYVANVGDSRAYLIDEQGINQITEDHSWVEEQVRVGLLTAEQARRHPQRNLVTRALGSKPAVEVDLFEGEIAPGQALLLCSDGLTGRVSDAEIADTVRRYPPLDAAQRLIAAANERGGNDNISVLLIHAAAPGAAALTTPMGGPAARRPAAREAAGRPVWPWAVAAVVVLALAALGTALAAGLIPPFWGGTQTPTVTVTLAASPTSAVIAPVATETLAITATETLVPTTTVTVEVTVEASAVITTPAVSLFTDTPTPTETATGTPTHTATPTDTPTATPTSTPEPTPFPYQAPLLFAPTDGETVQGTTTFSWAPVGEGLGAGDVYQLSIWATEGGDMLSPVASPITTTTSFDAPLDEWLTAGTQYSWTVVIVREGTLEHLSPNATTRTFVYQGPVDAVSPLTGSGSGKRG